MLYKAGVYQVIQCNELLRRSFSTTEFTVFPDVATKNIIPNALTLDVQKPFYFMYVDSYSILYKK